MPHGLRLTALLRFVLAFGVVVAASVAPAQDSPAGVSPTADSPARDLVTGASSTDPMSDEALATESTPEEPTADDAKPRALKAKGSKSKEAKGVIRKLAFDPAAPRVELFQALADGSLAVRVVPHNQFRASIFLTNETDGPITVEIPKAAAAVPVLKQFAPGNGFPNQNQNQNGNNRSNGTQPISGQFNSIGSNGNGNGNGNGPGQGFNFNGPGNNFFSIPAEKTVQIELQTVCLDHAKRNPSSKMPYALVPLREFTSDESLIALLESDDFRRMPRPSVQAAAWNLANNIPLRQLAAEMIPLSTEWFGQGNYLAQAKTLVDDARKDARNQPAGRAVATRVPTSPNESASTRTPRR